MDVIHAEMISFLFNFVAAIVAIDLFFSDEFGKSLQTLIK